jgi:hypothetical protein
MFRDIIRGIALLNPWLLSFNSSGDSPIFADGVPYGLKSFDWHGAGDSFDALMEGKGFAKASGKSPDCRRYEFPANNAVVSFT